jgi:hypothetical protein
MLSEKFSKFLLWLGVGLIFIGLGLFLWKELLFVQTSKINSEKFAHLGDYVGGIVGSIWSLAGVILFYVALIEQREDIQLNRKTLENQVKALHLQIEEFQLQRDELEQTREVFKEQSETFKIQRFENTFFQLLQLHHEIIDKLKYGTSVVDRNVRGMTRTVQLEKREVLEKANEELMSIFLVVHNQPPDSKTIDIIYEEIQIAYRTFYFETFKQLLSHYYRNIYHVFKFIYKTELIKKDKKQFYASLARAQLSSDELFLILYNSLVPGLGHPNFLFLIKEFDLMDNFDFDLLPKFDFDTSDIQFHTQVFEREIAKDIKPTFELND